MTKPIAMEIRKREQKIEVEVTGSLKVNNLDLALRAGLDGLESYNCLTARPLHSSLRDNGFVLPDWSPQWSVSCCSIRAAPRSCQAPHADRFSEQASKQSAGADSSKLIECTKLVRLRRRRICGLLRTSPEAPQYLRHSDRRRNEPAAQVHSMEFL